MKFEDDELEVYLKPSGKGQDNSRYHEKDLKNIAGLSPRKKISKLYVTNERFVVVVRFGKQFGLFSADAVKIEAEDGEAQSAEGTSETESCLKMIMWRDVEILTVWNVHGGYRY